MQTVNILGTEYEISYDCKTEDVDGETGFYDKKIHVRSLEELLDKDATREEKNLR